LLDDVADELVAEVEPNVCWEILDSGIDFCPSLYSWQDKSRERVILELERTSLDSERTGEEMPYTQTA
jgi:hypothetical protein